VDELVLADPEFSILSSLTADGTRGGLMTQNAKTGWDMSLLKMDDHSSTPLLQTPFAELNPMLSGDGRWLLYASNESGRGEIYVQRLDGDGGKWQISTDGGSRARWSRGGREIVFLSPDFKLMIADVRFDPEFSASVPRLYMNPGIRETIGYQYSVSDDGDRILVNRVIDRPVVTPVTLVQNWLEGLGK
jgi:dipeptidyl aminopeptidase/acylaminoacyl peptidase